MGLQTLIQTRDSCVVWVVVVPSAGLPPPPLTTLPFSSVHREVNQSNSSQQHSTCPDSCSACPSAVGGRCVAAVGDLRCALPCRRMVEACGNLTEFAINADKGTSRTVVNGLLAAQLGPNRIIDLWVTSKYPL